MRRRKQQTEEVILVEQPKPAIRGVKGNVEKSYHSCQKTRHKVSVEVELVGVSTEKAAAIMRVMINEAQKQLRPAEPSGVLWVRD